MLTELEQKYYNDFIIPELNRLKLSPNSSYGIQVADSMMAQYKRRQQGDYAIEDLPEITVTPRGVTAGNVTTHTTPTVNSELDKETQQALAKGVSYDSNEAKIYENDARKSANTVATLLTPAAFPAATPILNMIPAYNFLNTIKDGYQFTKSQAGKQVAKNYIGDMLIGLGGGLGVDGMSTAVTGKTVDQYIADSTDWTRIPYNVRRFLGGFLNAGGWLTFGNGSQLASNFLRTTAKTSDKLMKLIPRKTKSNIPIAAEIDQAAIQPTSVVLKPSKTSVGLEPSDTHLANQAKRFGVTAEQLRKEVENYMLPIGNSASYFETVGGYSPAEALSIQNMLDNRFRQIGPYFGYIPNKSRTANLPFIINDRSSFANMGSAGQDVFDIVNLHEATHLHQFLQGDSNLTFVKNWFKDAGVTPKQVFTNVTIPFSKFTDPVVYRAHKNVDNYLFGSSKGFTEILARMQQLKNAFDLDPYEDFTLEMFYKAKFYYAKDIYDNNMNDFFDRIIDPEAFVKLMNSKYAKKYLKVAAGMAATGAGINEAVSNEPKQTLKRGGNINKDKHVVKYFNF